MLKEIMQEFDEAKDDAGWDEGHPIFQMAQHIDDMKKLLRKIEKLAFDNVGAKTHDDADLALVQIHAIAKEA